MSQLLRSFVLAAATLCLTTAHAAPAKSFTAHPGTNTLIAARDAVRSWRTSGHTNEPAVIHLDRGEYSLTQPLSLDARDSNVTWEAPHSDSTLITGGRRLNHFTADTNGLWRATPGFRFEQLFINGARATRDRSPVTGSFKMESVQEEKLPNGKARITAKIPPAAIAALPTDPAALTNVQILVYHKWDTSRYALSPADTKAGTISVIGDVMQTWNPWDASSRFIFENCNTTPIEPGTWSLAQDGTLYYLPRPGEKLAKTQFIASAIEKFIVIRGANDLHFQGLRFSYTGYILPPEGCPPLQASARTEASIQIDNARDITFDDCEIAHTGNYGIWFRQGCQDCRVQHCLLEDLGAGGIRMGEAVKRPPAGRTGSIIADNNIIRSCGRVHPSAVGIWIGQSANNRVTHNDISDTFYTGISVGWTWGYKPAAATNNLIAFNRVHQIGQGMLSDMGGIYTLGISPGSACVGNVIYDVRAHDYGGWGIYPDEGSSYWRIESNLVWNCTCITPQTGGAFHQHYGGTNYIANNIFALSSGPTLQATRVEDHLSFTFERNIIITSNTFFTGPWDKIQYESRSNCFVNLGPNPKPFPTSDLATWQKAAHESGSIQTILEFRGTWPDITLPANSPALTTGFKPFDPKSAGVYGDRSWSKHAAMSAGAGKH